MKFNPDLYSVQTYVERQISICDLDIEDRASFDRIRQFAEHTKFAYEDVLQTINKYLEVEID